ncbi:ROK family protein [Microbacterium sp. 10M-3C3]|uniref:ROK family protein n=1 Tax=Microbacterium sp. 10M-3C3 TaxID=2483401 RepID=UPI001F0B8870|nr:ROK family protein [Microbacterium sp. 10M-3C3]
MSATIVADDRVRVGLDVGGSKTDAVAIDGDDGVLARVRVATGWGVEPVVRSIRDAVTSLFARPEVAGRAAVSIGIGIPGQVEPGGSRVVHAVNLGIDRLDVGAALEPVFGVPVRVENDVKAAALGAALLHPGAASMAYVNLGTGVAAGVVVDGRLWRGARGTAGEVGHIAIDPAGPLCRCGQRGCIEALAGGGAIAERWGRGGPFPVRDVFDAADAGDPQARGLRADLARGVAAAVRVLVLTADVDEVVLGGGLTALAPRLTADVAGALDDSAASSPFLRSLRLAERVRVLPSGSPAAAVGAALVGAADGTPAGEVLVG